MDASTSEGDLSAPMPFGTVGNLVTNVMDTKAHGQYWQILPGYAKPGVYMLSMQHAVPGPAGGFHLAALTDKTSDGWPDAELGRSDLMIAEEAGEWSTWTFRADTSSIFVGNFWPQADVQIFYLIGRAPEGTIGLGPTVFFTGDTEKSSHPLPTGAVVPRCTNIRVKYLGP